MSTCFFIGHRDTPDSLLPALSAAVEKRIIEHGVDQFVVGAYGKFDSLAAQAVRRAKKQHPDILLFYLRPYHPVERPFTPSGYDSSFYPPGMETVPRKLAIVRANRYMVDNSQFLIAYARYSASNAWKLTEYARKREKKGLLHVENLAQRANFSLHFASDTVDPKL